MEILVSVVLPTYNDSAERLEKSIKSIMDQTYDNFEVVIVDDGSREPFGGLDKKVSDPRIKWLKMEKNIGPARARNQAEKAAAGTHIAFLDAGDWWEPDKLERQMRLFEREANDTVLVYCDVLKHYDNGIVERRLSEKRGDLYRDLLVSMPILGSCSAAVVTRDAFEKVGGFYEEEDIGEDRELWLRISRIGMVDFVPEPLLHLEVRTMSRGRDPVANKIAYRRIIDIHEDEIRKEGLMREAMANYHRAIAGRYFSVRWVSQGIKSQIASIVYRPSIAEIKNLITGVLYCISPVVYWRLRKAFGKSASLISLK